MDTNVQAQATKTAHALNESIIETLERMLESAREAQGGDLAMIKGTHSSLLRDRIAIMQLQEAISVL